MTAVPISGYQSLIPAGANPQFNEYLQRDNLDSLSKFIHFICFGTVAVTMCWVIVKRVYLFHAADKKDDYDNFALFEDSDQKKLVKNGGGISITVGLFLLVFSLIMSGNIWVSL